MNNENLLKAFELFSDKVIDNKAYLSELDTPIGDGDHGNNMARGVTALKEALEDNQPGTIDETFKQAAMALMGKVGGASGPLYGSAMLSMSKKAKDSDDLSELITEAFEAVKKRGKSDVGDKTMLDVWGPAIDLIKDGELTADKLEQLAEDTKELKAKKGRASYLGERSVGHIDPGAKSSQYFFEALIEAGVLQ